MLMLSMIVAYILTGKTIFVWLTIMAGFIGNVLCWIWYELGVKQHIDDLVQKCIEDLKGGDYEC